jgi:hypothetical protein
MGILYILPISNNYYNPFTWERPKPLAVYFFYTVLLFCPPAKAGWGCVGGGEAAWLELHYLYIKNSKVPAPWKAWCDN